MQSGIRWDVPFDASIVGVALRGVKLGGVGLDKRQISIDARRPA